MRRVLVLVMLVFSATLAAVIGRRMDTEAMAVVVGVVCGVAAGIPMSLLVLAISNRRQSGAELNGSSEQAQSRYGAYPPVVVIQGGSPVPSQFAPYRESPPALAYDPAPRQFRVVGGEED